MIAPSPLDELLSRARELLRKPVRDYLVDKPWGGDEEPQSISADAYAYEAALMMRTRRRTWLRVTDSGTDEPRYTNASELAPILGIIDAAPFLGEHLLAEILPPPRS